MKTHTLALQTSSTKFLDLSSELRRFVAGAGGDGLLNVFVPHATAGVAVIETGSGSEEDLELAMNRLLPRDHAYAHSHGSQAPYSWKRGRVSCSSTSTRTTRTDTALVPSRELKPSRSSDAPTLLPSWSLCPRPGGDRTPSACALSGACACVSSPSMSHPSPT